MGVITVMRNVTDFFDREVARVEAMTVPPGDPEA
jgi:hypothetical protein